MTRDAYVFVRQYIHFCDNSKRISAGSIGHDPMLVCLTHRRDYHPLAVADNA